MNYKFLIVYKHCFHAFASTLRCEILRNAKFCMKYIVIAKYLPSLSLIIIQQKRASCKIADCFLTCFATPLHEMGILLFQICKNHELIRAYDHVTAPSKVEISTISAVLCFSMPEVSQDSLCCTMFRAFFYFLLT